MGQLDLSKLLAEVSADAPGGEDLSYDAAYVGLETMAQGTPERQVGNSIIHAQEPNWKEVSATCIDLLGRTRDLRIGMLLGRSLLMQQGIPGLHEGLAYIRGLLERFWEHVYPRLDPADGNDPLERVNILSALQDAVFRQPIKVATLCNSAQLGRFSLRDIGIAKREISPSADPSRPPAEMAVIDAAFGDTNTEDLTAQAQAAKDCMADVDAIEAFLTDKVGASKSIALDGLRESLREVLACVEGYLVKRGAISQASVASPGAAQGSSPPPLPASAIGVASGEFRSTQDILAALDRMCQYYERNEPSSPVPLVLTSAKRLVAKNFVEIMRQIPPDALRVLESLGGVAGPSETP